MNELVVYSHIMDLRKIKNWSGGIYLIFVALMALVFKSSPNSDLLIIIFFASAPFILVYTVLSTWFFYKLIFYDIYKRPEKIQPTEGYGCPKCWDEYESHIEVCVDCNLKLIDFSQIPIPIDK
ncbi:MAG: hypothetical protein HOK52_09050 [Candidatus Marinimicrobia bacterium]|jgi:hypothetical protein|nr:hypothetical protein [Candidatus Neomarinimicrobiota bacterium]